MNKQSRYMLRQNLSYYKNRIKYGITKLHSTVSDNYIVFESYGGKKATDSVRAIYDDLPGEILGSVSFFGVTSINRSCRIGYKIDKNYRQLGLGSLMVKHMLEILTHEKEMHRIEAYIHPQNISSINLVKSLGFISEGTAYSYVKLNGSWQDHLRFVYIS